LQLSFIQHGNKAASFLVFFCEKKYNPTRKMEGLFQPQALRSRAENFRLVNTKGSSPIQTPEACAFPLNDKSLTSAQT
jgi:hypothetical protein